MYGVLIVVLCIPLFDVPLEPFADMGRPAVGCMESSLVLAVVVAVCVCGGGGCIISMFLYQCLFDRAAATCTTYLLNALV